MAADNPLTDDEIRECFTVIPPDTAVTNNGNPGVTVVDDPLGQKGRVFRSFFKQGTMGTTDGGFNWRSHSLPPADEYYLSYDVYLPAGFNFPQFIKMPGLYGGSNLPACVGGGSGADGTNCVQFRINLSSERKEGDDAGYVGIGDGLIEGSNTEYTGFDNKRWNYTIPHPGWTDTENGARIVPGSWHNIEHHIKMNDVGQNNGVYEGWVNGVKAAQWTDNRYRTTTDLKLEGIFFHNYYGGSGSDYFAREDQFLYFDNFLVSPTRIGSDA